MDRRPAHGMSAVRPPASYELVLDQIRRAIQLGRFAPGERLPPERDLAQQLAVSRTTVREAMRVLQGQGLIEIRRGRGGAIVVDAAISSKDAKRELRRRLAEIQGVVDFRLIVEPAAARLAAERRTERDVKHLTSLVASMTETMAELPATAPAARFLALDSELHHAIAVAARNPLLASAVDEARAQRFLPVGSFFGGTLHPSSNDLHAELVAAVAERDADAAEETMRRHIVQAHDGLLELMGISRGKRRPASA